VSRPTPLEAAASGGTFGVSGYRARVGEGFDAATVVRFAEAFGTLVRDTGGRRVVLGRDTRPSGAMAAGGVVAGLLGVGIDVLDVGIAPTPTILHAAAAYDADGSVTVTGSHNPPEWNGLEFALRRGRLLDASERERLGDLVRRGARGLVQWTDVGAVETRCDAIRLHLDRILDLADLDEAAVRRRGPTVVVDAGNGAGSRISPELVRRLGGRVVPLFCEPDGRFPRSPEPTAESLEVLRETVRREGADVGFAHDSDADRLVLVDETGRALPEEYTFACVADVLLRRNRRPVVTTVVTGGLLDEVAAAHGVAIVRTPVGVGHVVERMRALDAAVGGESTGGVVVPGTHLTTDGVAAIALILTGMAHDGVTLSEWISRWRVHHLRRAKIPLRGDTNVAALLDALADAESGATIDRTDGVRLVWQNTWVCVRPSGTEPVLRVFAESPDATVAERLLKETVSRANAVMARTASTA
jgi:phosphomannomutase